MSIVTEWYKASQDLAYLKVREMSLRREICTQLLEGIALNASGSARVKTVIDGLKLNASHGLNYSIDEGALSAIWEELSPKEKEAFKFKPTLVRAKYKLVEADSLVFEAIVTKMGAPTLKVEEDA
jgi:hypothetical protein